MCGGMMFYRGNRELIKVFYPQPYPYVPCITKQHEQIQCIWGRRNKEEFAESEIPVTGWSRLEAIKAGKWHKYNPEKVYILADQYMEKDKDGQSHWFEPPQGKLPVGLMLNAGENEKVVYVVTIPSPEEFSHIHHRWPLFG
ncbi:hypothetical protein [Flexistipes sp.]|uniref:hypothetical protein n=1 Tax=Flexistipes sp. TaxID=3088135 RepID=UPI002E24B780|nr:hypothetical protein [Flexistipes sp.]